MCAEQGQGHAGEPPTSFRLNVVSVHVCGTRSGARRGASDFAPPERRERACVRNKVRGSQRGLRLRSARTAQGRGPHVVGECCGFHLDFPPELVGGDRGPPRNPLPPWPGEAPRSPGGPRPAHLRRRVATAIPIIASNATGHTPLAPRGLTALDASSSQVPGSATKPSPHTGYMSSSSWLYVM